MVSYSDASRKAQKLGALVDYEDKVWQKCSWCGSTELPLNPARPVWKSHDVYHILASLLFELERNIKMYSPTFRISVSDHVSTSCESFCHHVGCSTPTLKSATALNHLDIISLPPVRMRLVTRLDCDESVLAGNCVTFDWVPPSSSLLGKKQAC